MSSFLNACTSGIQSLNHWMFKTGNLQDKISKKKFEENCDQDKKIP